MICKGDYRVRTSWKWGWCSWVTQQLYKAKALLGLLLFKGLCN